MESKERSSDQAVTSPDRILLSLAALGALAGSWGIFLWRELLKSRAGGDPFCGFGGSECGALWDGPFASAIHQATGVPVAAWGVIWGAVACVLPLLVWADPEGRWANVLRSAVKSVALAGAAGVAVLLLASAAEGRFCQSCALSYVFSALYAAVALRRLGTSLGLRGAALAAGLMAALYLLVLVPGLRTPAGGGGHQELAEAVAKATSENRAGAGDDSRRQDGTPTLEAFLANLPRELLQGLSDSLAIYAGAAAEAELSPLSPPTGTASVEPRVLAFGTPDAQVRITEFTDPLCSHCATLHQTLEYLRATLPPTSFNVGARHFPLDGNCNPHLEIRGPESVRCMAARAQICLEDSPRGFEFAGRLFARQDELTPELVVRLAEPFIAPEELERCLASPETARRLADDVEVAWVYRPHGTPLVLINGRRATSFGPFLYAIVLAGGNADHPAFAALPPPNPEAHIH